MTKGTCVVCRKSLQGRATLYCGRKCRQHAYHVRHGERDRARYRAWHAANRERSVERVRVWRKANPERVRGYLHNWRQQPCPFCGDYLTWPAKSCRACSVRFGCLCHDNPECGIQGEHKHCPCGMAVFRHGHYSVEPCEWCLRDMRRLKVTFTELFALSRADESEAA